MNGAIVIERAENRRKLCYTISMDWETKTKADKLSVYDHRSFSNMIAVLINRKFDRVFKPENNPQEVV